MYDYEIRPTGVFNPGGSIPNWVLQTERPTELTIGTSGFVMGTITLDNRPHNCYNEGRR